MPNNFIEWIVFLLKEYGNLFIKGTINTIIIAVVSTFLGFMIGLLLSSIRTLKINKKDNLFNKAILKFINLLIIIYVQVIRGTPMMVQAMMFYYGLQQYFNIDMPSLTSALIIVSINTGAYMTEIIRGGINSVDTGQMDGALSIGMTHFSAMKNIILPQAVRNVIPAIGNEFIINIKDSSVLNVISVSELFFVSKQAAGTYLRFFESFSITALIYLVLTISISYLMKLIEKKMDGYDIYSKNQKDISLSLEE